MLLKKLTQLNGMPGNEAEVRNFILNEIKPYADEIKTDYIGNITAIKKGKPGFAKVMVSAHMDEVGLMVKSIDDAGFIKFVQAGGIDTRILVSKTVTIGDAKVPGVIGAKPIHLQSHAEADKPLDMKQLYIDIGATSKEDASKYVKKGDYIAFNSEYVEFGKDLVKAKALDDRCGCAAIIELLKQSFDITLVASFTVQEEIGCRGASIAAYNNDPDLALVLEGTVCSDVTGVPEEWTLTHLGKGPAISLKDNSTVYNRPLAQRMYDTAVKAGLPIQYRLPGPGGNDAGVIHTTRAGVPTVALSVPCRYIHSPSSVMNKNDYKSLKDIAKLFLKNIKKGEFIRE